MGTGFPGITCKIESGIISLAEASTLGGTGSFEGNRFNGPMISSSSPPSPPSPPVSPGSPPTSPPSPPPPPGCVHVCIDSWPGVPSPLPPPSPPPPPPQPRQKDWPSESLTTETIPTGNVGDCMPLASVLNSIVGQSITDILSGAGFVGTDNMPAWVGPLRDSVNTGSGWVDSAVKWLIEIAGYIEQIPLTGATASALILEKISGCETREAQTAIIVETLLGLLRRWLVEIPPALTAPWDYYAQWSCPKLLPGADWANEAYARNYITESDWQCLVRANGFDRKWQELDSQMRARQPSELDLLLLYRKGYFASNEAYRQANTTIGWTDVDAFNQWYSAQQWVPSPTDAIEWMIKDIADPQIQETFLLGAEFQQKYNGHVKEVFDWNGISEEDANSIWRSHWRNMAPTTLYELHKRLRPGWTALMSDEEVTHLAYSICPRQPNIPGIDPLQGRPESNGFPVPTYCEELPNAVVARQWLESLVTTGYHVSEGLGQADYPAFWRQRLLAVSYRVMTRIDARRAYETGQISLERLNAIFQDQGYAPQDAAAVSYFYRQAAIQLHSRRPICTQWVNTGYDYNLLKESLISQGMREDMWPELVDILEKRRAIKVQQECIAQIKGKFLKGKIQEQDAVVGLLNLNLDDKQTAALIYEWKCLFKVADKQETAASICEEFQAGLITGKQAQQLIQRLGYNAQAARRMLSLCYLRVPPKTHRKRPLPGTPDDNAMQAALDG